MTESEREDIMYDFAVQPDSETKACLERYLQRYPELTEDLIDLSFELSREVPDVEVELTERDYAMIEAAWQRHIAAMPLIPAPPPNPS